MSLRVGQTVVEGFSGDDQALRTGQTVAEAFSGDDKPLNVAQTVAEAFRGDEVPLRVGQLVVEPFRTDTVDLRVGQLVVEVFSTVVPPGGFPPGPCEPEPSTGLDRYIASVPEYTLHIECLEISHPDWSEPHRRVIQPNDWTVTIDVDGTPTEVTFPGWQQEGPWVGTYPKTDDSARADRVLSLDDVDNALRDLLLSVVESADPVTVRIWLFRSDVLTAPLLEERYEVRSLQSDRSRLELTCSSLDLSILIDPFIRHVRTNSPGLRGR